jgi:hypothetical protein
MSSRRGGATPFLWGNSPEYCFPASLRQIPPFYSPTKMGFCPLDSPTKMGLKGKLVPEYGHLGYQDVVDYPLRVARSASIVCNPIFVGASLAKERAIFKLFREG